MKKLVFAFVIMLGMGLTSCGISSEKNTEAVDTAEVVTDSIAPVDTLVVDTVVMSQS